MAQYGISRVQLARYHFESRGSDLLREHGGVSALAGKLQVRLDVGVEMVTIPDREEAFGDGQLPEQNAKGYASFLKNALSDFTLRLLCFCALLCIVIALTTDLNMELGWLDGVAILCTVAGVCNIQAVMEWSMSSSFRSHNATVNMTVINVLRDGETVSVPKHALVVGDLIFIAVGDILEADGILVDGQDIQCDESKVSANGHDASREEMNKDVDEDVLMFCGSIVTDGFGIYIVTACGQRTFFRTKLKAIRDGEDTKTLAHFNSFRRAISSIGLSLTSQLTTESDEESQRRSQSSSSAEMSENNHQVTPKSSSKLSRHRVSGFEEEEEEEDDKMDGASTNSDESEALTELPGFEDLTETGASSLALRDKISALLESLSQFAFSAAAVTTLALIIRYLFDRYIWEPREIDLTLDTPFLLEALITGIALVVVAVPEGLPLAAMLASYNSLRMMQRDDNLLKSLDAAEAMGAVTAICVDRTGTLTKNEMRVVRAYLGGQDFGPEPHPAVAEAAAARNALTSSDTSAADVLAALAVSSAVGGCGGDMEDSTEEQAASVPERPPGAYAKVLLGAKDLAPSVVQKIGHCICFTKGKDVSVARNTSGDGWLLRGNRTDCALLALAQDLGFDAEALRTDPAYLVPALHGRSQLGLRTFPMCEARMRSAQAVPTDGDPSGPCRLYVKGAAEVILALCTTELTLDDELAFIDAGRRKRMEEAIAFFASQSLRVLTLAYRDFETPPADWGEAMEPEDALTTTGLPAPAYQCERGLTLLAVLCIRDPMREGVADIVMRCHQAGVDVRLLSSDHPASAVAFAKACGILMVCEDFQDAPGEPLNHPYMAMTGSEFRQAVMIDGVLNQKVFDEVWPHLRVLSRIAPQDKDALVSGMCDSDLHTERHKGMQPPIPPQPQIVACTGSGAYDSPALRRAHVGFAVSSRGTPVAKDAADILLLNDSFENMVKACMWGRNVHECIARFVQFQMTVNINSVCITMLAALIVRRSALSVVHLLWVNLIMDSLGALALASEPPTEDQLNRPPCSRERGIISFEMVLNMVGQSIYQLTVFMAVLFNAAGSGRPPYLDESEPFVFKRGGWYDLESGIGREVEDPPTKHFTLVFNVFVMMQLFNWINCRKVHHEVNAFAGLKKNRAFLWIWGGCFLVQVLMVQGAAIFDADGVNQLFKTRALDASLWVVSIAFGAGCLAWQWVICVAGSILRPLLWGAEDWKPRGSVEGEMERMWKQDSSELLPKETLVQGPAEPEADGGGSAASDPEFEVPAIFVDEEPPEEEHQVAYMTARWNKGQKDPRTGVAADPSAQDTRTGVATDRFAEAHHRDPRTGVATVRFAEDGGSNAPGAGRVAGGGA